MRDAVTLMPNSRSLSDAYFALRFMQRAKAAR
jgi:hypothetical protein